jgi:hypothetical protein
MREAVTYTRKQVHGICNITLAKYAMESQSANPNTVLIVDANAVLASPFSFNRFQVVGRRIFKASYRVAAFTIANFR